MQVKRLNVPIFDSGCNLKNSIFYKLRELRNSETTIKLILTMASNVVCSSDAAIKPKMEKMKRRHPAIMMRAAEATTRSVPNTPLMKPI